MKKSSTVMVAAAVLVTLATALFWLDHAAQATRDEAVSATQPGSWRAVGSTPSDGQRNEIAGPVRTSVPAALPAWRIEGFVREPAGTPVPRAHVDVTAQHAFRKEEVARTLSDADGRYVVDLAAWRQRSPLDLRVFELAVNAWAPAHLPGVAGKAAFAEVGPDQELILRRDVTLSPGGLLTGRVVDANGAPVHGAFVQLFAAEKHEESGATHTDASGEYRLAITNGGSQVLAGSRGDVGWAQMPLLLRKEQDQRAPDLVLHATTPLRGVIVYADGQPVADLEVTVVAELDVQKIVAEEEEGTPAGRGVHGAEGRTAADGSFEFRHLHPGKYRVHLPTHLLEDGDRRSSRVFDTERSGPLVDSEAADTKIVLDLHRFRLRFRDEAGAQLVPSDVAAEGWKPDRTDVLERLAAGKAPLGEAQEADATVSGFTDDLLVPRGSWWCFATELRGRHRGAANLRAPEHPNETDVVLTLREVRTTATLRVELVAPRGESIAKFLATLQETRPGQCCQLDPVSEEAGTSIFRGVPGRYRLLVQPVRSRNFFLPIIREVALEDGKETTVRCEAVLGGRARLTVRLGNDESGVKVPGLAATLVDAPGEPAVRLERFMHELCQIAGWRTDGTVLSGVPTMCERLLEPGPKYLTVEATGYAAVRVPILIRAGEITDAEVRLAR